MYMIYLDDVLLPVTPSKLDIKVGNRNRTVSLINDGEINILKSPGLVDVSFTAMIPQTHYPFAIYPDGFKDAGYFWTKFKELKNSKAPFQFGCSRLSPSGKLLFNTNIKVAMEEWRVVEDAKDGLDLNVSIKLREYKSYGSKLVTVKDDNYATITSLRSTESAPRDETYTVQAGDTLWIIAKKCLGDGSRYNEILRLNKDIIGDPNKIKAGQVLALPS